VRLGPGILLLAPRASVAPGSKIVTRSQAELPVNPSLAASCKLKIVTLFPYFLFPLALPPGRGLLPFPRPAMQVFLLLLAPAVSIPRFGVHAYISLIGVKMRNSSNYFPVLAFSSLAVCAALGLALVPRALAQAEGGEPPYFAITNARIVTVSGPVIDGGTVVLAKGLIQAVGKDVPIPPEAWVIDGKGLTVYPGLIDAGTDIGLPKPEAAQPAQPVAGAGGRRRAAPQGPLASGPEDRPSTSPWRVAADELKTDDKRIEQWRNAGFTTVLSEPDDAIFPGQASLVDLGTGRPGELVVRPIAALPVVFRPIPGWFGFPDSLMGAIAYVRQTLDDTEWFAQAEPIYEANVTKNARPAYDRAESTLRPALESKELVLIAANNSVQIRRALRLAEEWKLHTALQGGQQGYEVAADIAAKKMPVLVDLKWPERAKDADPEAEQTLRELRFRDRAPSTPAAFAKAGVKFAFYSGGIESPKDIAKNLKKSLDAGLSPDAALRAFTLDAAGILGVSDRMGSIEAGKIANVIVTDGDLFNDKTKVKHVFVDGRWFEIHEAPPEKPGEHKPDEPPSRTTALANAVAEVGR
jgi:imidazolonepropionase-like amidohydrolase